jgi:methionine-rich copper-binding protein CopC
MRHRYAQLIIAVGVGTLAALPIAAPASAHTRLVSTDPAAGAVVREPRPSITLTFNEPVQTQFTVVNVTGPRGASYSDGSARGADRTLTQPIRALVSGGYRVVWRTVSADGHPVDGEFPFTADLPGENPAAPTPATSAATSAGGPAAPAPATTSAGPARDAATDQGPGWLFPTIVLIIVAAVAGAAGWIAARPRRRRRTPPNVPPDVPPNVPPSIPPDVPADAG